MVIAVDFDGTLCKFAFPDIGIIEEVNQKVIDYIRLMHGYGNTIILWTCRENTPERAYLDEAVEWCAKNNIPIDIVNDNPPAIKNIYGKFASRKIGADIYIDDKAINIKDVPKC